MFLMAPKMEELGRAPLGAVELVVDDAIDDEQKKSNDENGKPATRHERDRDMRDAVTLMTSFISSGDGGLNSLLSKCLCSAQC